MAERPSQEEIDRWHRWFAMDCNNRSWDLADVPQRSEAQAREMKNAAFAAAYHWSLVGSEINNARADVTIAHVLSRLGEGSQALYYAQRSLNFFTTHPAEDWDLAFAWLEVAYAAYADQQMDLFQDAYAKSNDLGQSIANDEDRQVFLTELAKIPAPAG